MRRVFTVAISVLVLAGLVVVPACAPDVVPDVYDLTMAVSPIVTPAAGTTDPVGTRSLEGGEKIDMKAFAADDWEFVNWTTTPVGAGTFEDATATETKFTMPAQPVTVTANFAPVEPEPDPEPDVRATIIRDAYGVPHIFAETKVDLAFGAGYAMAQDRLWQADVFRRLPSGRLAEFGLATIEQDAKMRGRWYGYDELMAIYDEWEPGAKYPHLKPMTEAYVDGINLYIEEALAAWDIWDWSLMPVEYIANGLVAYLEPFTVADVVAVTVMMAWEFGGTGGNEDQFYAALDELMKKYPDPPHFERAWAIFDDLFPLNDERAPVTIPDAVYEAPPLESLSFEFSGDLSGLIEQYAESEAARRELFESVAMPMKLGSNAVPVSPELSATGYALQLGGPQMGYSIPQIVYEIGLHGDGINAVGMAFPGAGPFILIGVSEYGAWTSTTGASDVRDIRVLDLNPDNPTQYKWYTDVESEVWEWRDMEERVETFYGLKKQTSEQRTFYRSHYGPIEKIEGLQAFTLHTPFYGNEMSAEQGWQLFQEAEDIEEFETAVELIWPSHNFVWSGVDGNIGYFHAGRFPVKPETADRRLPLAGDGTQEWLRVTEPHEMPRSINPEQGWLANWNNKPIAGWPFAESDFHWGEGHRVQVLMGAMSMMAPGPGADLTTAHLKQINQIGGYHHTAGMSFVGDVMFAAMASGSPTLEAAGGYLAAWAGAEPLPASYVDLESPKWPADPNPTYDHPGLTIFDAWYDRIFPKVFENILPPDLIIRAKGTFGNPGNLSLLIRVLREDESLLYPGYPSGGALTAMVVEALEEAVADLTAQYGADMSTWLTPVRMQNYHQRGALPGGPIHPMMNRGTYNHIAELRSGAGELPLGESVIPPGQSGFVGLYLGDPAPSAHVADQVLLYASWIYKPMHLTLAAVEASPETTRTYLYE